MLVLITKGWEAKIHKAAKPGLDFNYIQEVLNKRSNVPAGVNANVHAIYLNLAALLISEETLEVLKYKDSEELITRIANLSCEDMELDYSDVHVMKLCV